MSQRTEGQDSEGLDSLGRPNPSGNLRVLDHYLGRLMATTFNVDELCGRVGALRAGGGESMSADVDRYLVNEVSRIHSRQREAEVQFQKLTGIVNQLLEPPHFIARYLGSQPTPFGDFANVWHAGSNFAVAFADGVDVAGLAVGDNVFLSREKNAVIGKAELEVPCLGETASFVDRLDRNRIIVNDRDTDTVVRCSSAVVDAVFKAGDLLVWDRASGLALERLEKSGEQHFYEDIDSASPLRLGGHDEALESVLRRFTATIAEPDAAARYGLTKAVYRRLLLKGAPGTGKTTLMRIVASKISAATGKSCRIVTISASELSSCYVGKTEENIRRCFELIEQYDGPGIIFWDEIDSVGRQRGHISGFHDDRALGTILTRLEGMKHSRAAVIASTNRPDALDAALRDRFGWEIEMPRPNKEAAKQIFSIHLPESLPYQPNGTEAAATRGALIEAAVTRLYAPNADNRVASLQFRDGKRREIVARELVSGRLIEQLCMAARGRAFEREICGGESGIRLDDVQFATVELVNRMRTMLTPMNARSYLFDLPQDMDVVSVEAIEPRVDALLFLN